jgi:hypothetical protein
MLGWVGVLGRVALVPDQPLARLQANGTMAGVEPVRHLGLSLRAALTAWVWGQQHGNSNESAMLLNPFCPFTTARILTLKATVLLLLTLLIKAKVRIAAFSALGVALLLLQTLLFLAAGGALTLAIGAAGFYAFQQRGRSAA